MRRLDDLSANEVDNVLEELRPERLTFATETSISATLASTGNAALATLGATGSFNLLNPRVVAYLREYAATKIVGINATTRQEIASDLLNGIMRGEGVPQMARSIRARLEGPRARVRARTIARTEAHNAASAGAHEAMDMSGVVDLREWQTSFRNSRDQHKRMHGQRRPIKEPFVFPDGVRTMHPGGSGQAHHDVNCACYTAPYFEALDAAGAVRADSQRWRSMMEAEIDKAERDIQRAFLGGFASQLPEVLAALDRLGR